MANEIINNKKCKYSFQATPMDYKHCSLRGENDNCEEIEDCFVKDLQKQFARKAKELQNLSLVIRETKEYSNACSECADEILIYPNISGKTDYTQNEVELIALKRIIQNLKDKTEKYEKLKEYIKEDLAPHAQMLNEQLIRKTEECEKLKTRLITLDNETLTVETTCEEFKKYEKCEQVIEEIKKICLENVQYRRCGYDYEPTKATRVLNKIIAKIEEVQNDAGV